MGDYDLRLGQRLKKIRQARDLSQQQMSEKLGVSRSTVSQIENGNRSLTAKDLVNIADILNLSVDGLLNPEVQISVVLEEDIAYSRRPELRVNVPQKNVRKFKEVLLYILLQVGSKPNVGETVIYKLLYFMDFDFYEKFEEQLIGATYVRNRYGPTPVEFRDIVKELIREGDIVKVKDKYYAYPQTKYLPRRNPDLSLLRASEIKTIDQVLCRLSDMGARAISDYSHNDVPWLTTADNDVIEYESVFYRTAPYSQRSYEDDV